MIEPDLIVSAQHGEAAAWEGLVAQHQEAVFRLAYLLLGDSDDAQDVGHTHSKGRRPHYLAAYYSKMRVVSGSVPS